MKFLIEEPKTRNLNAFSNEELKSFGIFQRHHASLPIALSNLVLDVNDKNQLVINATSVNHRWLKVSYNDVGSRRLGTDFFANPFPLRGIKLETSECVLQKASVINALPHRLPISTMMIWLEPDSAEEHAMLSGQVAVSTAGHSLSIAIIPSEDLRSDPHFGLLIGEPKSETVYEFETNNLDDNT